MPTTPKADCPSRPRKPRRDALTLVAAVSANRPIFLNMTDLVHKRKRKSTHTTFASTVAVFRHVGAEHPAVGRPPAPGTVRKSGSSRSTFVAACRVKLFLDLTRRHKAVAARAGGQTGFIECRGPTGPVTERDLDHAADDAAGLGRRRAHAGQDSRDPQGQLPQPAPKAAPR